MSNLVPEHRLDSNGKLVKRWVRPLDGSPVVPSMPPPSTPFDDEDEELATVETLQAFRNFLDRRNEPAYSYTKTLLANVFSMPDSLAHNLLNEMYGNSSFSPLPQTARMVDRIYGEYSSIAPSRRPTVLRNVMSIVPTQDMLQPSTVEDNLVDFARGVFADVGGYMEDRLFSEDESRVFASVTAIAAHIYGDPDSSFLTVDELHPLGFADMNGHVSLLNRRSVDLLLPHAGNIDVLRVELQQRKSFHPAVVKVVIDGGVFRDGAL